jgi:hypothetical protein
MKKGIMVILVSMALTFSPAKAQAGGFWDGIKEAAHGVGWMFYMEACKLTWALFSEEGLNIGNLKYYCIHPQHDILHKPNRKR